jgi:ESAT-6 family protein
MDGYAAGSAELKQAAKQMEDSNANLMGQLSQLASSVEGIAGNWQGQAHTAFQTLMGRFAEDAKKLNDSLVQISEQISLSADQYVQQEQQAQESLSQITNTLGG